jgi:hypothetical protein
VLCTDQQRGNAGKGHPTLVVCRARHLVPVCAQCAACGVLSSRPLPRELHVRPMAAHSTHTLRPHPRQHARTRSMRTAHPPRRTRTRVTRAAAPACVCHNTGARCREESNVPLCAGKPLAYQVRQADGAQCACARARCSTHARTEPPQMLAAALRCGAAHAHMRVPAVIHSSRAVSSHGHPAAVHGRPPESCCPRCSRPMLRLPCSHGRRSAERRELARAPAGRTQERRQPHTHTLTATRCKPRTAPKGRQRREPGCAGVARPQWARAACSATHTHMSSRSGRCSW